MNYRLDKYGNKISILGFGCMRFAQKKGKIDMEQTERQIISAFQAGVNYYDTAYIYSGSEAAIGEIFAKHGIRSQINIAIRQELKNASKELEGPMYRIVRKVVELFKIFLSYKNTANLYYHRFAAFISN